MFFIAGNNRPQAILETQTDLSAEALGVTVVYILNADSGIKA
jgi:hypothetical protein